MIARACPKREPSEIGHPSMYHPILSRPAYIGDEWVPRVCICTKTRKHLSWALFHSAQQQNGLKSSGGLKPGSLRKLMTSLEIMYWLQNQETGQIVYARPQSAMWSFPPPAITFLEDPHANNAIRR
jgi:hypothetical protein